MPVVQPIEDTASYPRVYRASVGWLIGLTLCGVVLALGGLIGSGFLAAASLRSSHGLSLLWLMIPCFLMSGLGLYCLLSTFRSQVVLFADRIEVKKLTRTEVLGRNAIRAWKSLPTSPITLVLLPRETTRRPLRLALVFPLDLELAQWLYPLPCLDGAEARKSKAEVRNDIRLGATPGERMRALARGRRVGTVVNAAASLIALWGFVYPTPYGLAILGLAATPWIALAVVKRSRGLLRLDGTPNDAHPNLAVALIHPSLVLLLRAVSDYSLLGAWPIVWYSTGIGVLLCWSAFRVDPSLRAKSATDLAVLVFSLLYRFGVAVQANAFLDRSPGVDYSAHVLDKYVSRGKMTSYVLDLEPWGPKRQVDRLQVDFRVYNATQRGETAHLTMRNGALGVNWYYLRALER